MSGAEQNQSGKIAWVYLNAPNNGRFCVIQDPAGAVAALYSPLPEGL